MLSVNGLVWDNADRLKCHYLVNMISNSSFITLYYALRTKNGTLFSNTFVN